jgi:actin-like protein 6A
MVEVLMEDLGVPAVFFAKSPVLVCYANARTSGLVVELGATYSSVSTVHDGYAFAYPKSQVALFGGHDLDAFLRARLAPQLERSHQQGATTVDGEIVKRTPRTSRHWWSYAIEAKESGLCRAADGAFDAAQNSQLPLINYELPDKTIVTLGTERFSVAEQLFDRSDAESSEDSTVTDAGTASSSSSSPSPILTAQGNHRAAVNLPGLICETAGRSTETELRRELFQNVVLSGGGSCFDNLPTRIEREVVASLNTLQLPLSAATYGTAGAPLPNLRVKVVAAHAQERKVGAFLGGSILASLGSFHEMWLSKAEYAEHGAALVHKKCP